MKDKSMLELFEEFFELGIDALDTLCLENSWADYPDEEIDKERERFHELGETIRERLFERKY